MKLRLVELQAEDGQAQKIRAEKLGGNWQDCNEILHHQGLLYLFQTIRTELIKKYHDNLLVRHFGIKKMQKLVTKSTTREPSTTILRSMSETVMYA